MSTSTLAADIESYLRHCRAVGLVDATLKNYRHSLSIFLRAAGQRGCRRIADITQDDLRAAMVLASDEGRAKSSRVHMAVTIKQAFQWFQDEGRILRNPALGLPLPDDGEEDLLEQPLSEDEVSALFTSLPRRTVLDLRNACLLELLYGCGLRIGEACALRVDDIDLMRRTLTVRQGKGGQDRLLPLMTTAAAAVKDYLSVRRTLLRGPDLGMLFLSQYGKWWERKSVYNFFRDLNTARGPDARHLHPHLFRHSIAVHLLRGKADIRYIQDFLGHADLETTKQYLRLVPGRLKEEYDKAMPDIAVDPAVG
jgi:site-specific recombinase XerD